MESKASVVPDGDVRITISLHITVEGKPGPATEAAIGQFHAFFVARNGLVCTTAHDAATATGDSARSPPASAVS